MPWTCLYMWNNLRDINWTLLGWNHIRSCTSTSRAHQSYSERNLPKMHMAWVPGAQHQLFPPLTRSVLHYLPTPKLSSSSPSFLTHWVQEQGPVWAVLHSLCCTCSSKHKGQLNTTFDINNIPVEQGHLDNQTLIYVTGGVYKSAGFGGKSHLFVKPLSSVWLREALIHDLTSRQNTIKRTCLATGQREEKDSSIPAECTSPGNKGAGLSYANRKLKFV